MLPSLPADTVGAAAASRAPAVALDNLAGPDEVRRPKAGTELVDQRTENSKTFATNEPGKFVTQLSDEQVHFKDAAGKLTTIDSSLGAVNNGRRAPKSIPEDVDVAATGDDPALARLRVDDGHAVAFGLEGAAKVTGVVNGSTIAYRGAKPETEVRLTVGPTGVKEELVLSSSKAPDRFVFPLDLVGLTATIDERGDVLYRDASGAVRARTPHGFMVDSSRDPRSDEPARSQGVTYSLVTKGKQVALEVQLDRAWLNDPARIWPVIVDPTTTSYYTDPDDTYVQSWYPADNSGDTQLKVGTYNGGADKARSFMHFGTTAVNGKIISSARLKMYEYHSYSCDPRPVSVHRVTQGWWGVTMTGYPGASLDGTPLDTLNIAKGWGAGCPAGWVDFNVTAAVASWASGGNNFGLALQADEGDSYGWKKFYSSESGNGSHPVVEVTWSDPVTVPGTPQAGTAYPFDAAGLVTWAPPASNGGATIDQYLVAAYDAATSTYTGIATTACGSCSSAVLGSLVNGRSYFFAVWAHNAVGYGNPTLSNTIIAGTPLSPRNVGVAARNQGAIVSWASPDLNGTAPVDLYGVFAYKYPSIEYVSYTSACSTCTWARVSGLTNGQAYIFGVYAHNAVNWGTGVASPTVTPALSAPDAPRAIWAPAGANGTASVGWEAPANNGGMPVDTYWIGVYTLSPLGVAPRTLNYVKAEAG